MKQEIPIVAVVGPTATGKTALSIRLAKAFDGEILSCDAMQIYQGLDIGTAKPSKAELAAVPHHLIGFLEPEAAFSVSDYVALAETALGAVRSRGKRPFLVGGTGLYARSLLQGNHFAPNSRDPQLRARLEQAADLEGIMPLYEQLQGLDAPAAAAIHPHNEKRVLRALEYCLTMGTPFSQQGRDNAARPPKHPYIMLCLMYEDRALLYQRINQRVDEMMDGGLLAEARAFYERLQGTATATLGTAAQAIGYKELFPYFRGTCTLAEAVETLKQNTRRYAKRQMTWFRREQQAHVLTVDTCSADVLFENAAALIKEGGTRC